jgi:Mannosyltransferase (PIG-V)
MATIASEATPRTRVTSWAGIRMSAWVAIACSRLIALAAGAAGATLIPPTVGWRAFDPHGLTLSLGRVGNVLAASTDRWDGVHYVAIAQHGYRTAADTVFFPLYPLLIHIVSWVTRSEVLAGVLISLAAFVVALILLHRLAREELGNRAADATVLILAFAPLSFFFSAVYTESLFLAFSVAAFYLARHERFAFASMAAAGATLTHLEGIVLIAPLALMYWQTARERSPTRKLIAVQAAPLLLPAVALAGFVVYLRLHGYAWTAPLSNETGNYHVQFTGPLITLARAISAGLTGLWQTLHGSTPLATGDNSPFSPGFQNLVYLVIVSICVVTFAGAWRRLPKAYCLYTALVLIVCTSGPVEGDPLHAFDRYVLVLFPLWMVAGAWLSERRVTRYIVEIEAALLLFYTFEFAHWVFIA